MKYNQKTGELINSSGKVIAKGYAGCGVGKNNPLMQDTKNVGPLPKGKYLIGNPVKSVHMGPYCLPLIPDPTNVMFGRGSFYMHGDSIANPGTASNGCIIMPRAIRELVNADECKYLTVI